MKLTEEESFLSSTVPKAPIQALKFLETHPAYDGRGVKVAILDTGVDPGAAGLQITSTGGSKIIDIRDSTGAGDVDTSKVVKASSRENEDGDFVVIKGIAGNDLKISMKLVDMNSSEDWHVGRKAIYEFLPRKLVKRLKAHTLEKCKREHNEAFKEAEKELKAWKESKNSLKELTREEIRELNELQNRVKLLEGVASAKNGSTELKLETTGPMTDIVAFKDKQGIWRVLIDLSGDGDLTKDDVTALASYYIEREYIRWNEESQLNICVNVYDEGNLVSLVADVGDHGTHVASILAGYHPENPELNGVAPGAEIISLKIGDGRLGSMETASSMIRAISMAAALGADIINMSYGEASTLPQSGRVVELMEELVEKHGVIFVTSAGNSGPALSTVGSPACSSDSIIGVGAYVSPDMMISQYNMREELDISETNYTWSSRGPSYSGNLGVCISAPGGAIASVSEWTLQQKGLKNGTSMASPNAAGGIALLVSGLMQEGVKYSPARVKRAVECTARTIENLDRFTQGNGLLQVASAFEHILQEANKMVQDQAVSDSPLPLWYLDLPFKIQVGGGKAGIYLREPNETGKASKHTITIVPKFNDSELYADGLMKNSNENLVTHWPTSYRNKLQVRLSVKVDVDWIKVPSRVFLHGIQSLDVIVDPSGLIPGQYFTWIKIIDESRPEAGPLLKVPVSVIRPDNVGKGATVPDSYSTGKMSFRPGKVVRKFLVIPEGATWMDIKIINPEISDEVVSDRLFYVHCVQMHKLSCYRDDEMVTRMYLSNEAGEEVSRCMAVKAGTVEICISQFWKSEGVGPVSLEVRFRGVIPTPSQVILSPQNGCVAKISLKSKIRSARIEPTGKLKNWHKAVRPNPQKTKLFPLNSGFRDEILPFRLGSKYKSRPIWSLELEYSFKQLEDGKVTASIPNANNLLYESPLDSQMCMIYDENKQLLWCTDAWPTGVQLGKGTYTARVCLRHEKPELLSELKNTALLLTRGLSEPISVTIFKNLAGTIVKSHKFSAAVIEQEEELNVYVKVEYPTKIPKGVEPGDVFTGSITYCKRNSKEKGWGGENRPGGYVINYVLPPKAENDSEKAPSLKEESLTAVDEAKLQVIKNYVIPNLKSRISTWKKVELKYKNDFDQEYVEINALIQKYRDNNLDELDNLKMDLLQLRVDWAVKEHNDKPTKGTFLKVVETCNKVLDTIPEAVLQSNPVTKVDFDDINQDNKDEKEFIKYKTILVKVLSVKLLTHIMSTEHANENDADIEKDLQTIAKFIDSSDPVVHQLKMERYAAKEKFASSIIYLNKLLKEDSTKLSSLNFNLTKKELFTRRIQYCEKLGWKYLADIEKVWMDKRFPSDFALF